VASIRVRNRSITHHTTANMDDMDLGGLDSDKEDDEFDLSMNDDGDSESEDIDVSEDGEDSLYRQVVGLCGGPDLMQVFGPSGSGKSTLAMEILKSALKEGDKKALIIDTERNVLDVENIDGADYVYIPEWHDLYHYVVGNEAALSKNPFGENTTNRKTLKDGYDVVLLDSIGFPALVQYGEYRVDDNSDQFKVFNELQVITGKLKQYSQRNEALAVVINQPKSDLSGETNPPPFGDKSIFGFKEIWLTEKLSSSDIATKCSINAFRSRQAGRGASIYELKISDSGVDVEFVLGKEEEGWM